MIRIDIKPISTNQLWKGKKYKTILYDSFRSNMYHLLPTLHLDKAPYKLVLEFGCSSKLSDIDNFLKGTIDCLVNKYNFDDREIYSLIVDKIIVPKGKEYIKFEIISI